MKFSIAHFRPSPPHFRRQDRILKQFDIRAGGLLCRGGLNQQPCLSVKNRFRRPRLPLRWIALLSAGCRLLPGIAAVKIGSTA